MQVVAEKKKFSIVLNTNQIKDIINALDIALSTHQALKGDLLTESVSKSFESTLNVFLQHFTSGYVSTTQIKSLMSHSSTLHEYN